jgi:hypothetical protein
LIPLENGVCGALLDDAVYRSDIRKQGDELKVNDASGNPIVSLRPHPRDQHRLALHVAMAESKRFLLRLDPDLFATLRRGGGEPSSTSGGPRAEGVVASAKRVAGSIGRAYAGQFKVGSLRRPRYKELGHLVIERIRPGRVWLPATRREGSTALIVSTS